MAFRYSDQLGGINSRVPREQVTHETSHEHVHGAAGAEQLYAHQEAGNRCIRSPAKDGNEAQRSQKRPI